MLFVSTTTFVSALAVFATMTGFVHATGPRTQCTGMSSFPCLANLSLGANWALDRPHTETYRVPYVTPACSIYLPFLFANCIRSLASRQDNATCAAIEQQTEVTPTALESMNPGINCKFFEGASYGRTQFQGTAS
jgi:hypothetical protein